MKLHVEKGSCGYPRRPPVLTDVNFSVESGEVLCLLGANGAGKSTLFKSILGLLPLISGTVMVDGDNIFSWKRAKIAQSIGYIPQATNPPFSYTVTDVILMGRAAYLAANESPTKEDEKIAEAIIDELNISKLADKSFLELSGGEKQLVVIARALTQQPDFLIMDEPTSALDFGNQQMVLQQVGKLSQRGLGIVMASHFPDQVFTYAHKAILLKDGGIFASGTPEEVVTEGNLWSLYNVGCKIVDTGVPSAMHADHNIKVAVPLG